MKKILYSIKKFIKDYKEMKKEEKEFIPQYLGGPCELTEEEIARIKQIIDEG